MRGLGKNARKRLCFARVSRSYSSSCWASEAAIPTTCPLPDTPHAWVHQMAIAPRAASGAKAHRGLCLHPELLSSSSSTSSSFLALAGLVIAVASSSPAEVSSVFSLFLRASPEPSVDVREFMPDSSLARICIQKHTDREKARRHSKRERYQEESRQQVPMTNRAKGCHQCC